MSPASPVFPEREPPRILVVQLKRLGDLVLATPLFRAVRAAWPTARLTLVTEAPFHELLEGSTDVDEVRIHPRGGLASLRFGARLAELRAAVTLDLQGSATSARLALQSRAPRRIGWGRRVRRLAYTDIVATDPRSPRFTGDQKLDFLRPLGVDPGPAVPRLVVTPEAAAAGRSLLAAAGVPMEAPLTVVAPASRRIYKRWHDSGWSEVVAALSRETGARVVVACGPGEKDQLDGIAHPQGRGVAVLQVPDLRSWLGLLSMARLLVAPDGGVRQMAQALGRPTFGLFGPQNPVHWVAPLPERLHRAYRARRSDCAERCAARDVPCRCLLETSPGEVLAALSGGPGAADATPLR